MSRSKLIIIPALLFLLAVPVGVAMGQEGTPISAGASGTVIIWDDLALGDAITLSITGVTPPEAGTVYEGWLVSDDGSVKKSTGILTVADDGTVNHTFYSGENLIDTYNKVVITVEPIPDNDPGPSTVVLAIHEIPLPAMAHIRHLLTDWKIPAGSGILTNLKTQLALALLHSRLADNSTTLAGVRQHIEHVVNIIEGPTGANFGDLDGNGSVQNPGDGVGALVHAADRKHAGFASAAAADDTVIADHAAKVMEYGGNAETWAIQARDEALRALTQSNVLFAKLVLSGTIGLLDSALHGNANTGEGGADQAYVEGQLMATYTLMPGAPPPKQELTPTPVPTPTPTPTPEVKPPDSVGETSIPAAAQMALALAALLLVSGGLLVLNGRRSRA